MKLYYTNNEVEAAVRAADLLFQIEEFEEEFITEVTDICV